MSRPRQRVLQPVHRGVGYQVLNVQYVMRARTPRTILTRVLIATVVRTKKTMAHSRAYNARKDMCPQQIRKAVSSATLARKSSTTCAQTVLLENMNSTTVVQIVARGNFRRTKSNTSVPCVLPVNTRTSTCRVRVKIVQSGHILLLVNESVPHVPKVTVPRYQGLPSAPNASELKQWPVSVKTVNPDCTCETRPVCVVLLDTHPDRKLRRVTIATLTRIRTTRY